MRAFFEEAICDFIVSYCQEQGVAHYWRAPVVRFADAAHPGFAALRDLVTPEHHLPSDYLDNPGIVLSYFLPFKAALAEGNVAGRLASPEWAKAYLVTNEMSVALNHHLAALVESRGGRAAIPTGAGMIGNEKPLSLWSQRHVAYLAGHGSFGINNMLISDEGCCGRYFSIVTDLDVPADPVVQQERCLYKSQKKCGLCIGRCVGNALTADGFDRFRCLAQCLENAARHVGADVCGKCDVGLPCSLGNPAAKMQINGRK